MKTDLEQTVALLEHDPDAWAFVVDELQAADAWDADTVRRLVCTYPAADGPRHVAAAWFDGAGGDPQRAELIRVGLELVTAQAVMDADLDDKLRRMDAVGNGASGDVKEVAGTLTNRRRLEKRHFELLHGSSERKWWTFREDLPAGFSPDHPVGWWSGNTGLELDPHSHCFMFGDVRRGYVEEVWTCWAGGWDRVGDQLIEHQPVRTVNVDRVPSFQWEPTDHRERLMRFTIAGRSLAVPMNEYQSLVHGLDQLRLLLRKRWPGIEFKWPMGTGDGEPPAPPREHYVFRPGDMVSAGGDGRLVPTPGGEQSLTLGRVVERVPDSLCTYRLVVDSPVWGPGFQVYEAAELPPATRFEEFDAALFYTPEPGDPVYLEVGGRSVGRCRRGDRCVGFVQRVIDTHSWAGGVPEPRPRVRVRMLPKPEVWR